MPSITVAMITMNEEKAVAKVIDDIRAATTGSEIEILVVDSSRDRTAEIAAEKVSLWNDRAGLPRPQRALWLTNSSGNTRTPTCSATH